MVKNVLSTPITAIIKLSSWILGLIYLKLGKLYPLAMYVIPKKIQKFIPRAGRNNGIEAA